MCFQSQTITFYSFDSGSKKLVKKNLVLQTWEGASAPTTKRDDNCHAICMQYSPNDKFLAAGMASKNVALFDMENNGKVS